MNFRQFTVKFTRIFFRPGRGLSWVFDTQGTTAKRLRSATASIAVEALQLSRFSEHRARMTERTPSVIGLSSAFSLSLGAGLRPAARSSSDLSGSEV